MHHVRSKTSSLERQVKSYVNRLYALEATFSVQYSWKLVPTFALLVSKNTLKMGQLGKKLED